MVSGIGSGPGATDSILRKAPSRTIFDSIKSFRVALPCALPQSTKLVVANGWSLFRIEVRWIRLNRW